MCKVVDLACGTNPIKDADVFTDMYISSSKERKAHKGSVLDNLPEGKSVVCCDIQCLPFDDKVFDYSYARQILEHVEYPERACEEIIRISKGGIIISPTVFGEVFFGWKYHRWLIIERDGKLYFFEKRKEEDRQFGSFFKKTTGKNVKNNHLIIPEVKGVFDTNKRLFNNYFEWEDEFEFIVVRETKRGCYGD